MGEQDARASLAFDISYGAVEEPAGEEDSLRGTDGGGADVAVQDRLLLILRRDSDNKQSDNKAGDDDAGGASTASCFLGPELQAEFRADVAQKSATADSSAIGGAEGTMGGGWQQDKVVVKEGLQVAAAMTAKQPSPTAPHRAAHPLAL